MYLSGFKYREIAERTGVSLGTIKSRIFHCRKTESYIGRMKQTRTEIDEKDEYIGILTSGGDASGMNAAIRAVTRAAILTDLK